MISIAWCTVRLLICAMSDGICAMRLAISSVRSSSSSAGNARVAKPHSTASTPVSGSPVSIISMPLRIPPSTRGTACRACRTEPRGSRSSRLPRRTRRRTRSRARSRPRGSSCAPARSPAWRGPRCSIQYPVTWRWNWPSPDVNQSAGAPASCGIAAEVVAGREALPGAADDRHPHVGVGVGFPQGEDDLAVAAVC